MHAEASLKDLAVKCSILEAHVDDNHGETRVDDVKQILGETAKKLQEVSRNGVDRTKDPLQECPPRKFKLGVWKCLVFVSL